MLVYQWVFLFHFSLLAMQAVPQEEPGSSYLEATPRGRGSTSRPRDAAGFWPDIFGIDHVKKAKIR